jgi:hypothetical protein
VAKGAAPHPDLVEAVLILASAVVRAAVRAARREDPGGGYTPNVPPDPPLSVVIAAILQASLCVDCIASKTGLGQEQVVRILARIGKVMSITASEPRCDLCGGEKPLHRLA